MLALQTPIDPNVVGRLNVGDQILLSGTIFTGRDAVLPKIVRLIEENRLDEYKIDLRGGVVFHTAVSNAGVGPTSSNKLEIESSIPMLSKAGVRIHLGKGAISRQTINALSENNSLFAIIPPVTALLENSILQKKLIAFPELGMEAFYSLDVKDFPIIVAAVNNQSIYE